MIVQMFYSIGGFDSEDDADPSYIDTTMVTTMYIPVATIYLQSFLGTTKTITVTANEGDTELSSGDLYDDRIISLFAVSLADQDYDNIHIDPDSGDKRNFHYELGYQMMLSRYGIYNKDGELVPPNQGEQGWAALNILKVEMDY